jgi:hypothetical protein
LSLGKDTTGAESDVAEGIKSELERRGWHLI